MFSKCGIYAHRGLWSDVAEKNTLNAFIRAVEYGFSIETDVLADYEGVFIGHDFREIGLRLSLSEVLQFGRIAINLKMDSAWKLDRSSRQLFDKHKSFFFDGSPPVMFQIMEAGLRFANRVSDFEDSMRLNGEILWIDSFRTDMWWQNEAQFSGMVGKYKQLIFVSPELHGRNPNRFWDSLIDLDHILPSSIELGVCTDHPIELAKFLKL